MALRKLLFIVLMAGLGSLTEAENLHAIARWRGEDMVKRGYFAHNDRVSGVS